MKHQVTNANLSFAVMHSPVVGQVLMAATAKGVCVLALEPDARKLPEYLGRWFPHTERREDAAALRPYHQILNKYFERPALGLSLPLDLRGTPFQCRVWRALMEIPVGQTRSYQEIARQISTPTATRAVAGACAANRIAFAVPCHRVIRSDGSLGGYHWGLDRKQYFLSAERRSG